MVPEIKTGTLLRDILDHRDSHPTITFLVHRESSALTSRTEEWLSVSVASDTPLTPWCQEGKSFPTVEETIRDHRYVAKRKERKDQKCKNNRLRPG